MTAKAKRSLTVVGVGGIGGVTAALLKRGGYDVSVIVRSEASATLIRERGIHVWGSAGEITMPLPAFTSAEQALQAAASGAREAPLAVLIATKAFDLPSAALAAKQLMGPDTLAVSLQNGICVDELAAVVGPERVVGCAISFGATTARSAEVEMTSSGTFRIGFTSKQGSRWAEPLAALREALSTVVPTTISDNIRGDLYSKVVINCCITTLGALTGMPLGQMLSKRLARTIFIQIAREAMQVAGAAGLDVPPYNGKLDLHRFLKDDTISRVIQHALIRIIGLRFGKLRSSSLQSLERGQKTEVEWFNGYVARLGREHGVATPVNDTLTRLVHEIEAGKRGITPDNLRAV